MGLLLAMALYAALALAHAVSGALATAGSHDFHSYWYSGQFLRQGRDPYHAYVVGAQPALPIHYLDGGTTTAWTAEQLDLGDTPANTAPMTVLLTAFSLLSWPPAKALWLACNLALLLVTPLLSFRLAEQHGLALSRAAQWFLALLFYCLAGSRETIVFGQTTLLVFVLMQGSVLLTKRHARIAGLLLGLALSKYSLALPVLLYLLLRRRYGSIAIALATQLAGLLAIAAVSDAAPRRIVVDYVHIFLHLVNRSGVQLASYLPPLGLAGNVAIAATTLLACLLGYAWAAACRWPDGRREGPAAFGLLGILALWSLLAGYHGFYDSVVALWALVLAVHAVTNPPAWRLPPFGRHALVALVAIYAGLLSVPGTVLAGTLPFWTSLLSASQTAGITGMVASTLWLLYRRTRAVSAPLAASAAWGGGHR